METPQGGSVQCLQFELELGMLVFVARGKIEYPGKNPQMRRTRINNKLCLHMMPGLQIKSEQQQWEASIHAITLSPAPQTCKQRD